MQVSNDFSSNISIDKGFRKFKMFSKDIQFPITSDEPNERDDSIGKIIDLWQTEFARGKNRSIPSFLNDLEWSLAFKAAIPMVLVVEELKILGLGSKLTIAPKPLPSIESSVVRIIKALHDTIAPGFSDRDEDHFDPQRQAESENNAKGTRITIASAKTELIVDLKKVWDPHGFPTADQA